jgi:hypothetical protein
VRQRENNAAELRRGGRLHQNEPHNFNAQIIGISLLGWPKGKLMKRWRRFKTRVFVAVLMIFMMAGIVFAAGLRAEVHLFGF